MRYTSSNKLSVNLALFFSGLLSITNGSFAQANTLNFDAASLTTNNGATGFTEQGFKFNDNMNISDAASLGESAFSGGSVAFNDYFGDAEITRADGGLFSFNGLYVKDWLNSSHDALESAGETSFNYTVTAYNASGVVGSFSQAMTSDWVFLSGNYSNITRLVISNGGQGGNFMMDNVNVNVSPVPEAEEWAMMSLGLAMIGFANRRRKSNIK